MSSLAGGVGTGKVVAEPRSDRAGYHTGSDENNRRQEIDRGRSRADQLLQSVGVLFAPRRLREVAVCPLATLDWARMHGGVRGTTPTSNITTRPYSTWAERQSGCLVMSALGAWRVWSSVVYLQGRLHSMPQSFLVMHGNTALLEPSSHPGLAEPARKHSRPATYRSALHVTYAPIRALSP